MKYFVLIVLIFANFSLAAQQQTQCSDPKAHEFDFWIGDWTVYKNGTDTIVGHNNVILVAGCSLQENWKSSNGFSIGTSLNKYNFAKKKWQQMWVDNSGLTLQLEGDFMNGKMILENEQLTRDGKYKVRNRITWSKNIDGSVRQFWEQSYDEGNTWRINFDGLYKK